jgi:hypothetical protein
MRNSNAIKNLSIAAEALSRISEYKAEELRGRVFAMIDNLLKEDETPTPPPPYKPTTNPDDEIPF